MGNTVSCFDPMREHPPYSWPKDHPGREAAIRERKLARRNHKLRGSHPTEPAQREAAKDFESAKPSVPEQQAPVETPIPTPEPTAVEERGLNANSTSPPESVPVVVPSDDSAPNTSEQADAVERATEAVVSPSAVSESQHDGDDSVTVEQAPPTAEGVDDTTNDPDAFVDPVAPVNVPPFDAAAEESVPAAEVPTESPSAAELSASEAEDSMTEVVDDDSPILVPAPVDTKKDEAADREVNGSDTEEPTEEITAMDEETEIDDMDLKLDEKTEEDDSSKLDKLNVPEDAIDEQQQYADADEPELDTADGTADNMISSIDTRRAMFDHAEDMLPEASEVKRDVLDPVTNEFISLGEYRQRQRERAQGVVRERVEKFEEIDDELSRQKAKLAAIEQARVQAKEKVTWSFKNDSGMPRSPMARRDASSYIQDNEKFIDSVSSQASVEGKIEPTVNEEVLSANLREAEMEDANAVEEAEDVVKTVPLVGKDDPIITDDEDISNATKNTLEAVESS